ncbi:MAG: CinA family nicotinamide mononucleotide deamidase-related protein [Proteobacteria bacterium]|nr:CinA family nicotinamide mononucleotide deamidase-related protein [Pseudomonadota bacterium]
MSKVAIAEIVSVGSELLLGRFNDTNASWLSRTLTSRGIHVQYRTTVGDVLDELAAVFRTAMSRADVVVVSGGLGPTDDDLTREAAAMAAGADLVFSAELMGHIEAMFRRVGFTMTENNRRQAYVPAGARPLENDAGTAPGFIVEAGGSALICVPGVPAEMKRMILGQVLPWLAEAKGLALTVVRTRLVKVCGIGESGVDERLKGLLGEDQNPAVGLLASPGEVRVRITAGADTQDQARTLLDQIEAEVRARLGEAVFGVDAETLEGVVARLLSELGLKVAVVETFTGGAVCRRLVAEGQDILARGVVLPDEAEAAAFLDLPGGLPETLRQNGPEAAWRLADRVRGEVGERRVGLAVWGPTQEGDGPGQVRVNVSAAVVGPGGDSRLDRSMSGPRAWLMERLGVLGLDMLRRHLSEIEGG